MTKYFIFLGGILNGTIIFFLLLISSCSLLVYRIATDFCILTVSFSLAKLIYSLQQENIERRGKRD